MRFPEGDFEAYIMVSILYFILKSAFANLMQI